MCYIIWGYSSIHEPAGILPTPFKGTGSVSVQNCLPRPIPFCTLPETRQGLKTCDNP